MAEKIVAPIEDIHKILSYDSDTGLFRWKERSAEDFDTLKGYRIFLKRYSGKQAMCAGKDGYLCGRLFGRLFLSHRVAWAMHYFEWPELDIDHINQDKTDNRICNLRLATDSENLRNIPKFKSNTSGYKGVSFCKANNKWVARVSTGKEYKHLGSFNTKELAYNAYISAAKHYHGDYFATSLERV